MNTLTKVFVVLLVIFSIAFTMMVIQFSVTVPNWKDQAEKWKLQAQQCDTMNRNLIAAGVATDARSAADRKAWDEQKQTLADDLQAARKEADGLKLQYAKAESDLSAKDGTVKKLAAELGIAQASAAKAREQRSVLEERNIHLEKANLDLSTALNEKLATLIVMEQQGRQQEQSMNLLKDERDKLLKKLGLKEAGLEDGTVTLPTDKVRPSTPARVTPIRGQVDQINGEFASLSVGSDDGVEVGMTFIIYNDSGYMGDLNVTDVEPSAAAGKVKFVRGRIAVGDRVVDERSYLAMN